MFSKVVLSACLLGAAAYLSPISSAQANDTQGWYLGLGVGYDHQQNFTEILSGGGRLSIPTTDSGLVAGSFGYKWANNLRLEAEVGWDRHEVAAPFSGNTDTKSFVINSVYDIPLNDTIKFSIGAGIGAASFGYCTGAIGGPCTGATGQNLLAQLMLEVSHAVTHDVNIFLQARERIFLTNSAGAENVNQQALLLGIRWYIQGPPQPERTIRTTNIR